jgi:hypothetical protein
LSDEEIATFFERAQSSGMTEAQLEKAAKAQGYTSADMHKLRSRLTELGDDKSKEKTHNCCSEECTHIALLPEDEQKELRKGKNFGRLVFDKGHKRKTS